MVSAQLTLTPAVSKRIISKGIASLPEVKRALRAGKILISTGITTAYLFQELAGMPLDVALACGIVTGKGPCIGRAMTEFLGAHGHARFWLLEKGKPAVPGGLEETLETLGSEDVFIKGANAIDREGRVAVMMGMEGGGTIGKAIGHVMAKGIHFIIPVGLEKTILGSVDENAVEAGIRKVSYCSGMPVGLMPLNGKRVTEIEAMEQLAKVKVLHMASGGINGAEGSVTLLVKGQKEEVQRVINVYKEARLQRPLDPGLASPSRCHEHKWAPCIRKNILFKENVKRKI